jgi:hypothetical protein
MSGDAVCCPSLFEGMSAPKAVGPPWAEKDRVLWGCVSLMRGEKNGGRPFLSDVRSLGVHGSGTLQLEGIRRFIMHCQVGSARHGPFKAGHPGPSFRSWDVPESTWCGLLPSRDPLRIASPLPPDREWWGGPWHWTPDSNPLAIGVSRVSSLLGRNWRPMVPGLKDPGSSPQAFRQAGGWSRSPGGW